MGYGRTAIHWRITRGVALAVCLASSFLCANSSAKAQAIPTVTASTPNFRPLSEDEGRSIADAARDHDQPRRGEQDCSHLVHQTYLNAGYDYPYASSFELYAGHENFDRVRNPQPGDLIVWPGHVGIVLEPTEHSFYSLVSTGLEAQNYLGPYWKSRGRPRFYRYKVETTETLTTAKTAVLPRVSNSTKPQDTEAVIEERAPVAAVDPNRPPRLASERTKVLSASSVQPIPAVPIEKTAFEVPQSIIIAAGNKLPTNSQVAEGISELSNAAGSILRADVPTSPAPPIVVFDRLRVERLDIKKDHGWARLQIDSRAIIKGGETDYKRRREKVRWELRRTESGWEAVAPTDRTYVPSDVAVKNLAAQLARLTNGDGAAARQEKVLRQESQVANLLSALLEEK